MRRAESNSNVRRRRLLRALPVAALGATAGSHSISMAITWKTPEVRRINDLHFFNSMLRGLGWPQKPPGVQPAFDAVKLAFYRTATAAVRPLRGSMAMRRILRRVALGKRANYYLKDA